MTSIDAPLYVTQTEKTFPREVLKRKTLLKVKTTEDDGRWTNDDPKSSADVYDESDGGNCYIISGT